VHPPAQIFGKRGDPRPNPSGITAKAWKSARSVGSPSPKAFEGGLERLGAKILIRRQFTDHHRYTEQEIITFINECRDASVEMIVTTEKDSVRFPRLPRFDVPMYFLRVEIGILSNEESFTECIDRICRPRPLIPARRFF